MPATSPSFRGLPAHLHTGDMDGSKASVCATQQGVATPGCDSRAGSSSHPIPASLFQAMAGRGNGRTVGNAVAMDLRCDAGMVIQGQAALMSRIDL